MDVIPDTNKTSQISTNNNVVFSTKLDAASRKEVFESLNTTWRFNATNTNRFRSTVIRSCKTPQLFVMTKKNVKINSYISYDVNDKSRIHIDTKIHKRFPRTMPFKSAEFQKCNIVGNSGILLGSKCGTSIDSADFVFRYNLANTHNYSQDVGMKTDLVTCNPTLLSKEYSRLNKTGKTRFKEAMLEKYKQVIIYIEAFGYKFATPLAFRAQDALEATKLNVLFPNPESTRLIQKFWKEQGVKSSRLSTGGAHRMPSEVIKLMKLHKDGVIQLHTQHCGTLRNDISSLTSKNSSESKFYT
ncbi:alpha-2,8-sialyltransferase 8E-like [Glandiceps talaboti]